MNYKPLKHYNFKIESKGSVEFDPGDGAVLVPQPNTKIFLHWINSNGKLVTTYTMTFPTQINSKVRLINAQNEEISIQAIYL